MTGCVTEPGVSKQGIQDMAGVLERVPPFPRAAREAIEVLDSEHYEIGKIAPVLESDPALAARVLRVANSPFYGLSGQIAAVRDACIVLGQHTLRNLVMAAAIIEAFKDLPSSGIHYVDMWRHCLHTALIGRKLAGLVGENEDVAYTAGLLHDVGELFMVLLFADQALEIQRRLETGHEPPEQVEQQILGFDHAMLTAAIAEDWRLPEPVVKAIRAHHDVQGDVDRLATLIHIADTFSAAMSAGDEPNALLERLSDAVLERLGLSADQLEALWSDCPRPQDIDLSMVNA